MWKRILALLKAQFPGMREDVLTNMAKGMEMAVKTEEDAKKLVDSLDKDKVEAFSKDYRSGIDREISEANKTFEKGLRDKYDFKEKDVDPNPGGDHDDVDPNDIKSMIAAGVAEAMKPMAEFMTSMKMEKTNKSRLDQINEMLKDVPESYKNRIVKDFGRMTFADDTAFNEYLTDTKADVDAYVQEMADAGLSKSGNISFGQLDKDGVSAAAADYIKAQTGEGGNLGGKEL